MENRYKIDYDIKLKNVINVNFKQGNVDSSVLDITLLDNGQPCNLTGQTIEFRFLKSDDKIVFQDASAGVTIIDAINGNVECVLKSNTIAAVGDVICEIHRVKDTQTLTTQRFTFNVEASISGDGILSTNYIGTIDGKLIEMNASEAIRIANENTRIALYNEVNTKLISGELKGDKGDKGDRGYTGLQGIKGDTGAVPDIQIGTVTTLQSGGTATVTRQIDSADNNPIFDFAIPRGIDGTGVGDMIRTDYDSNNDGKVNSADSADTAITLTGLTSTVADIDSAVDNSHTHANKTVIDLLTDSSGKLNYNGSVVGDVTSTEFTELQTNVNNHLADYVRQPAYAVTSGTANTYTVTLNPAPTAYVDGMGIVAKIHATNTGASTIKANSLGDMPIVDSKGNALTADKLKLNLTYSLKCNLSLSAFQLLSEGGDDLLLVKSPNLIINSSFENDLDGWETENLSGVIDTSGNYKFGTKALDMTAPFTTNKQSIVIPTGHKIYACTWYYASSAVNDGQFCLLDYDGASNPVYNTLTVTSGYQFTSLIKTVVDSGVTVRLALFSIPSSVLIVWDGVMLLDLTAAYGAGNEPTQAEMDAFILASGGWWDGDLIPKISNIFKNGGFENGLNCWTASNANIAVNTTKKVFGTKSLETLGKVAEAEITLTSDTIPYIQGHKYYVCYRVISSVAGKVSDVFFPLFTPYPSSAILLTSANKWYFHSFLIADASIPSGNYSVRLDNNNVYEAVNMCFDGAMLFDLTAAYGAGNEPTKEKMDAYVQSNGGYWDSNLIILTADANAIASDITLNKIVYVNGIRVVGTRV